MTLHYEAMQAEIAYRHEQARRSWPTRASKPEAAGRRRLWSVVTHWVRLLNRRRRTAASAPPLVHAPADHRTPAENIVRVHITCWTDGTQPARQVVETIQEAMGQRFTATTGTQLQTLGPSRHSAAG